MESPNPNSNQENEKIEERPAAKNRRIEYNKVVESAFVTAKCPDSTSMSQNFIHMYVSGLLFHKNRTVRVIKKYEFRNILFKDFSIEMIHLKTYERLNLYKQLRRFAHRYPRYGVAEVNSQDLWLYIRDEFLKLKKKNLLFGPHVAQLHSKKGENDTASSVGFTCDSNTIDDCSFDGSRACESVVDDRRSNVQPSTSSSALIKKEQNENTAEQPFQVFHLNLEALSDMSKKVLEVGIYRSILNIR